MKPVLMLTVLGIALSNLSLNVGAQSTAPTAPSAMPAPYDVKEHYTKYEYRIPMRDGKRLATTVYVPKDAGKSYPFLMTRTPYSCAPYGVDQYPTRLAPSEDFLKAGYIFVCQDVRGRYMSEGTFIEMTPHRDVKKSKNDVDESTDMYDSVEWLLKNIPGNSGKLGIWGISYPGFYTSASIIDSHPAIKAASPQAPIADFYMRDDSYHGGAYMLPHNFGFYTGFKPQENPTTDRRFQPFDYGTKDAYEYFLKLGNLSNMAKAIGKERNPYFEEQIEHDTYDEFWKSRALPPHLKNIKAAVLTVGGWFDAEDLQGALSTYRAIEDQNPGISNALVMGPWVHGGWIGGVGKSLGNVDFAMKNSEFFQKKIMFPFFEQHLKGAVDAKLPEAYVFETGTNVWRQYAAWPPANAKPRTLYFHAGGKLSFEAPASSSPAFDQYVSDPNKPVPFVGYTALGMPREYMVSDQRFASTRPDVLVYQSDVLEDDLTLAGPISPKLFVSTSGTDADWVVKIIDVYPPEMGEEAPAYNRAGPPRDVELPKSPLAGYQQLVRGDPLRARYRNGFEKPEPLTPGKVEAIRFDIPDVNHTFRKGHRIMVHIQSSWFPLLDRNPQTFVRIKDAKPEDFQPATQRVYRSKEQPSGVGVRVIEASSK
jgi:putative CocE/NonD family hydrolase